jgi:hypothetical protein
VSRRTDRELTQRELREVRRQAKVLKAIQEVTEARVSRARRPVAEIEDTSDPVSRFLVHGAPTVAEIEANIARRLAERELLHQQLHAPKRKGKRKGGTSGVSKLGKAISARRAKMSKVRQAVQAGRVVRRIKIR